MKILVLADIHSNIISFKEVLKQIKKIKYDLIIFLGDYITDGEDNNKVLKLVKKYGDYSILGNREEYILNYKEDIVNKECFGTTVTTYHELSSKNYQYLKGLDKYKIINIDGKKILLIHGQKYFTNGIMDYDQIITDYDFDICFFAHTHVSCFEYYKDKYFLNPGSVGEPIKESFYKYCVLDVGKNITANFFKIPVSKTFIKLKKHMLSSKHYAKNYIWYNLCLATIKTSHDYVCDFMDEYHRLIQNDEGENEIYRKLYKEKYKLVIEDIIK